MIVKWWIFAGIVLLLLLQYTLWLGKNGVVDMWRLQTTVERTRAENQKLITRNHALEAEVIDLKTGEEAIEERAREELGMIKPGEMFIRVVEPITAQQSEL